MKFGTVGSATHNVPGGERHEATLPAPRAAGMDGPLTAFNLAPRRVPPLQDRNAEVIEAEPFVRAAMGARKLHAPLPHLRPELLRKRRHVGRVRLPTF